MVLRRGQVLGDPEIAAQSNGISDLDVFVRLRWSPTCEVMVERGGCLKRLFRRRCLMDVLGKSEAQAKPGGGAQAPKALASSSSEATASVLKYGVLVQ